MILIIFTICTILFADSAFCDEIAQDTVIAEVEGQIIIYKEIAEDPEKATFVYRLQYGREPSEVELSSIIDRKEIGRLAAKIQDIIKQKKIKEFGIDISDKEMEAWLRSFYTKYNIDPVETTATTNKYFSALAKALREVQKNPAEERKIYEQQLSILMSYEEWTGHRRYYNTPEKISWIEKSLSQEVEDLYKPNPAIEAWMLNQKLKSKITEDVSVTDRELKDYYNKVYSGVKDKPIFIEVREQLREQLIEEKKRQKEEKWWQEQYKKANIKIKVDKFKNVMNILIPSEKEKGIQKIFAILVGVVIFMGVLIFSIVAKRKKRKATSA